MELSKVTGIGTKNISLLNSVGIYDVTDLLSYYPYRYQSYILYLRLILFELVLFLCSNLYMIGLLRLQYRLRSRLYWTWNDLGISWKVRKMKKIKFWYWQIGEDSLLY